jgi:UDP:flavonoid glycosyltransferase YjiC (YdhE family)
MRVLIISAGSWGDIAPHTGLAARIGDAGHDVTLATHDRLAPQIRDRGLAFRSLDVDISDLFGKAADDHDIPDDVWDVHDAVDRDATGRSGSGRAAAGGPGTAPGGTAVGPKSHLANLRQGASLIRQLVDGIAGAMRPTGEDGQDAEPAPDLVLLSATVAPLGWHVAEGLGIPTAGAYLQPATRTAEFPPPFLSGAVSLGRRGNRALTDVMHAIIDTAAWPATRRARRDLGLSPLSPHALRQQLEVACWPIAYGYSPAIVPRPRDWRPGLEVTGYWFPPRPTSWRPSARLVDFLAAGPPPVLVSFGSMAAGHGERVSEVTRAALRRAGVRGVIQSGLAGLAVDDDDAVTVGDVPHDWLMPRCAAVVHHSAAGTTASGLRAGIPAVPVPVRTDQQFWAHRLTALGVSPGPQPFRRLSPDGLGDAVRRAVSEPSYRERAAWIAGRIADDDGPARVVEMVERLGEGQPVRAATG